MKKVLFVSHESSRTGAPITLLLLARWLRLHQPGLGMDLLALKGGALHDDFTAAFDSVFGPRHSSKGSVAALKQYLRPVDERERILMEVSARGHRLIYANTIISAPAACRLKDMNGPGTRVICHVHELKAVISMYLPSFRKFVPRIDHFIAASQLVKDELVQHWGAPEEQITVVYECAQLMQAIGTEEPTPKDFFEVGASGNVHWRKGYDLFLQVARSVRAARPDLPVRFTWVGHLDDHHRVIIENDLARAGLSSAVRFVGEQDNPMPWYRRFDVLILPSREDPFPLVCIETGMLGKPVICFRGATGIAEVLGEGGGYVVPYMDTGAMAERVVELADDPTLLAQVGAKARDVFAHFSPEEQCPRIAAILNNLLD